MQRTKSTKSFNVVKILKYVCVSSLFTKAQHQLAIWCPENLFQIPSFVAQLIHTCCKIWLVILMFLVASNISRTLWMVFAFILENTSKKDGTSKLISLLQQSMLLFCPFGRCYSMGHHVVLRLKPHLKCRDNPTESPRNPPILSQSWSCTIFPIDIQPLSSHHILHHDNHHYIQRAKS